MHTRQTEYLEIVIDTLQGALLDVQAAAGSIDNVNQMIKGYRAIFWSKDLIFLEEVEFQDYYRGITDRFCFLLYDGETRGGNQQFQLFSSDAGLKFLAKFNS